jgi:hypothetical protein
VVKTITSKQDRPRARTAADIEQKYNFGQTFAEVFNLITDAQKAAEEAQKAIDSLDHEQIFNLLTDNGRIQGVYRGDDGNVYINATYIKSGKLAAEFIDADNLNVNAANITGSITFNQLGSDVSENMTVKSSNISGSIVYNQLSAELQQQIESSDTEAYLRSIGITTIDSGSVKSPCIEGGQILGAEIYGGIFSNLESANFLRMRSDNDFSDPDNWRMVHVLEHFVGDVDSNTAITQMGYVGGRTQVGNQVVETSAWVLFVLGSMVLSRDTSTGTMKALGKWDFSGATVTGL